MRRPATLTAIALGGGFALITGWAWAGIEGSKHDFSDAEWSGGDACGVCHAAQSDAPATAAPLWDPGADLTRTFGTPLEQSRRAGGGSQICLRCHDGTIARDAFASESHRRIVHSRHPGIFQSGHATSNHPVGVDYPRVSRDYRPATTVTATGEIALPNGKVECISCHDPHGQSGVAHMLVASNARSALCLACHRK